MTAPQDDPLAAWSETWGQSTPSAVQALAARIRDPDEFAPQHAFLLLRILDRLIQSAQMERAVLVYLEEAAHLTPEDLS